MQGAGYMMIGLGTIIGPSIGHFYAGDVMWGLGGTGLRLLAIGSSAGLIAAGGAAASDRDSREGGIALMALGAAAGSVGLGLVIWDLVDAPEAARRANREHAKNERKKTAWVPDVRMGLGAGSMRWTF